MINDLQDILRTVIYAPPPNIASFVHSFNVIPTRVSVRKEKALQLWSDIKKSTQ